MLVSGCPILDHAHDNMSYVKIEKMFKSPYMKDRGTSLYCMTIGLTVASTLVEREMELWDE